MKRLRLVKEVVAVEVVPVNKSLQDLEIAARIIGSLRATDALSQLPISCSQRLRQVLAQIETDVLIIRKTTVGNGR